MQLIHINFTGGFGNQLFQLALAHHIVKLKEGARVLCFFADSGKSDEFASMSRESFQYISERFKTLNRIGFLHLDMSRRSGKYYWRFRKLFVRLKLIDLLIEDDSDQGSVAHILKYVEAHNKPILFLEGYFQNANLLLDSVLFVGEKLNGFFADPKTPFSDKAMVHIRRGDYLNEEFNKNFGTLNDNYYSDIFDELQAHGFEDVSVFISNLEDAKDLWARYPHFSWVSKSEMDWQRAFERMVTARRFYGANSTFSFWISLIVQMRKGTSFLPRPWAKLNKSFSSDRIEFEYRTAQFS